MTVLDVDAIRRWTWANQRARESYYRHLNFIDAMERVDARWEAEGGDV